MRSNVWVKCPVCTHKLFLIEQLGMWQNVAIQVKCHSCKSIIKVEVYNGGLEVGKIYDER